MIGRTIALPRAHTTRAAVLATLLAAAFVLTPGRLAAQPEPSTPPQHSSPTDAETNAAADARLDIYSTASVERRLAALDGDDPMRYFELAEDIAYNERGASAMTLARQLFVIAWEIDRARPPREQLGIGRSVCLALADLATAEERRFLLAMAASLRNDPDAGAAWTSPGAGPDAPTLAIDERTAFQLSEALARFRAGEGRRLADILETLDAEAALRRIGLPERDVRSLLAAVQTVIDEPRCPRCKNDRVVRAGPEIDDQRYLICPECDGHSGPSLNADQLLLIMRAEALLLGVEAPAWSAHRVIDNAAPIRSLDPAALAETVGVNPDARTYRFQPGRPFDGQWR